MALRDTLLGYLIDFHARHANHGNHDFVIDSDLKRFSGACLDYLTAVAEDKISTLNKVKELGMQMKNEMASQMWHPLAKLCDIVMYWNAMNPVWIDQQLESIQSDDYSRWNQTSFCNLARIAVTYPCNERGIKCSEKIRDYLFSN